MTPRIRSGLVALIAFLSCLHFTLADGNTRLIQYQSAVGETVYLEDNRKPALYTGNFGDCLGGSAINVTRFDAAYYQDNMTVLFHIGGNSGLNNESLMMYIGVYAYGESRFNIVFNPCDANVYSMCPVNSSIPIQASGIIPVGPSDVANIPPIALTIPDFEGEAILRIFSNATHEEIACYSAAVTNGNSFSQPAPVGSILGIFTLVAVVASFATAIYGEAVPTMRLHYAHSLSVGVVFSVWQHIFFSGALSMNWPSVLVAWWSNFAWAGGMIYTSSMQSSIDILVGNDVGNTSQVGAAQAGSPNSGVGGGFDIASIYKRSSLSSIGSQIYNRDYSKVLRRDTVQRNIERALRSRDNSLVDASEGYIWYGKPVASGVPLPGNYSGFAGTLAEEGIPVSNAFMTGFLWFLIVLVMMVGAVMAFKWTLEGLVRFKWIKKDRLKFFRDRWLGYSAIVALRVCYIGWFAMMFLTIFQFTFNSSAGTKGVAGIVFAIFFIGMPTIAGYAFWYKRAMTGADSHSTPVYEHNLLLGKIPVPKFGKASTPPSNTREKPQHGHTDSKTSTKPLWKRMTSGGEVRNQEDGSKSVHDDEDYIKKFGWLSSRFRRTRWWFFTAWLFYEFLRAVFYGGASGYAQAQVFGLLIVEISAFAFIIWMKPFEGQRLNILVVYCLGFSKVMTVALSAAFDVQFNLPRIATTAIGIIIVVIQGILTIITMVAIVVGAISSYMSISRNQEEFKPRKWAGLREKYFDHLDRTVNDLPKPPKVKPVPVVPEAPKFGFEMKDIKRVRKIEDEDEEFQTEIAPDSNISRLNFSQPFSPVGVKSGAATPVNRSRANSRAHSVASMSVSNLPFGARPHRRSWATPDFVSADFTDDRPYSPVDTVRSTVDDEDEDVILPEAAPKRRSMHSIRSIKSIASLKSRPTSLSFSGSLKSRPTSTSFSSDGPIKVRPVSAALSVGGEVSTLDTIGLVPAPTMRVRSGTSSSVRSSPSGFSNDEEHFPQYLAANAAAAAAAAAANNQSGGKRNSYGNWAEGQLGSSRLALAPTQEADELSLHKTRSNNS